MPREFELIARHFRPLAGPAGLDLSDDAALLTPPPGRELVISADAMVEGVHFLPGDPPETLGRKVLRANLSDLAAMGAVPLAYLLTLAVPSGTPDSWFAAFAAGLALDQAEFGVQLIGGDSCATPGPVTLSITILGHVAPGQALRRRGAREGDVVYVTGTIGDGALGLLAAQGKLADPDGFLAMRYRLPQPRLGFSLHGIATAGMDISDGLIQDTGHLARAAGLGAEIELDAIPLSEAARGVGPGFMSRIVSGGDDYELLLAVPPANAPALAREAARLGIRITEIGRFVAGHEVRVRATDGTLSVPETTGWSHF